jgi:hypothetical protein
MKVLQR